MLRTPGALPFAIPGIIGRFPMSMLSLAQVLLVVAVTGRYGVAGAVSATGAVLFAVVTPRAGTRPWRAGHGARLRAALLATVLGVAPLAVMPGIWEMAVAIFVAGLGISATLSGSYRIAGSVVPAEHRTEGMSWLTTAAATGTALGAPLAGRLIDAHGTTAGYLFAFAGLVAIGIVSHRHHQSFTAEDEGGCSPG